MSYESQTMRLPVAPGVTLEAGFAKHEIVGEGWRSALLMPCPSMPQAKASYLAEVTWRFFHDPQTNLLGGWSYDGDTLLFEQWNTMSEARNQEQLGSYHGRHTEVGLWGFTSTLSDVLGAMSHEPVDSDVEGQPHSDTPERAGQIVAAIADQARPAVAERRTEEQEPADRRLLWLENRQTLAVAVWFNPIGPTVSSIEVCALPDGSEYLVCFRRHPFAPYHCVLGQLTRGGNDSQLFSEATDLLVGRSLPNVLALWDNPDATAADVPDVLRDRILEAAGEGGRDLAAEGAWIEKTMGNPWEFAAVDQTEAEQVKTAAKKAAAAQPSSDGGFAAWWEQVSSFDNVVANFRVLPEAWDGALNTQRAFGNLGHFDVDPLLVTYSNIGMPGPDCTPSDN